MHTNVLQQFVLVVLIYGMGVIQSISAQSSAFLTCNELIFNNSVILYTQKHQNPGAIYRMHQIEDILLSYGIRPGVTDCHTETHHNGFVIVYGADGKAQMYVEGDKLSIPQVLYELERERRLIPYHPGTKAVSDSIYGRSNIMVGVFDEMDYAKNVLEFYYHATDKNIKYIFVKQQHDAAVTAFLHQIGHYKSVVSNAVDDLISYYFIDRTESKMTIRKVALKS